MMFVNPAWLLLGIPLLVSLWFFKPSSRFLQVIRILIIVLILLSMAGFCVRLPSRRGTVVVVADRSGSMPPDAALRQKEMIGLMQSAMGSSDRLAVVSFGQKSVIERSPQGGKFSDFTADVGTDASNLAGALESALGLVGRKSPGRVIVISDGKWTGRDPVSIASQAAGRDISVDYRLLQRAAVNDLAIYQIDTPESVTAGESFMINVWIQSPLGQQVSYRLSRGSQTLVSSSRAFSAGLTRLTFRDSSEKAGTIQYVFNVSAGTDDPVPENNTARILVGVEGQKPLLCVSDSPDGGFANLLREGLLNIEAGTAESCNWQLEDLSNYSAVIIEDVSAGKIGTTGMENIAAWVRDSGAGLMMTGGKESYGPGGYFRSPFEPVMPVSMELRKEHRKLSLAIVVALDRSGSMTAGVAGGKTKMDLANLATVQVLDMLTGMDEFGVIAVDSSAHIIVNIAPVEETAAERNRILSIDSLGGGIFIYEALSNAAKMISEAEPLTKHIILFADAADSERPDDYIKLLEKCTQAGITVSVIGLGKPTDQDARLLEDVARRGQGRIFFTESAEELPRLFAQDTFVVARSSFLDEPTAVQTTAGMYSLTGRGFDISQMCGGYNLCYLREGANLAAVTVDEYEAPFVAAWQAGIGRSLCYTGQANGPYTGEIAQWDDIGAFFTSLARWVAGAGSQLGPDMLLTQQLEGGICTIKLHLDPERQSEPFVELPRITTLQGRPGSAPQSRKSSLQFVDADTLAVEIPLFGSDTFLSTVEVPGQNPVTLPAVCLPYSPEFQPADIGRGPESLVRLAKITGGKERIDLAGIWADLPKRAQMIALSKWLLLAAVILLLAEVLERRTGLLTGAEWKIFSAEVKWFRFFKPVFKKHIKPVRKKEAVEKVKIEPSVEVKAGPEKEKSASEGLLSALSKAQRTARKRTERKKN